MTHPQMYRINAVDHAGNPWYEATLMDPIITLQRLEALQALHPERHYWVDDPDDDERGDIQIELEEACVEAGATFAGDGSPMVLPAGFKVGDVMPGLGSVGIRATKIALVAGFDQLWAVNKPEEKPRPDEAAAWYASMAAHGDAGLYRSEDADRQISHRVWAWRVRSYFRRIDWWKWVGVAVLACSAAFMVWLLRLFVVG